MKKIEVNIPDQIYQMLQTLVTQGWFRKEEDVIEQALRNFLQAHSPELMEQFIREDLEWGLHGKE